MAESIMLDKAKDFAVEIINMCKTIKTLSDKKDIPYYDINDAYRLEEEDIIKNIPFDNRVREMIAKPMWVIAGNYVSSLEMRFKESDTIFFLDYPKQLCWDIITANQNKNISWGVVVRFHMNDRNRILAMLERDHNKKILVFKTEEEKECYLKECGV